MLSDYLERHPFPGLKLYWVRFRKKFGPYDGNPDRTEVKPFDLHKANCLSSEIVGMPNHHKVVLDIDMPVVLHESSPGKFHLIIDKTLHWENYEMLLRALCFAGIIEQGYYQASYERRATFIRLPWIKKEKEE